MLPCSSWSSIIIIRLALVNKLVPCAWLLSGALEVWSLRLRLRFLCTLGGKKRRKKRGQAASTQYAESAEAKIVSRQQFVAMVVIWLANEGLLYFFLKQSLLMKVMSICHHLQLCLCYVCVCVCVCVCVYIGLCVCVCI